MPRSIAGTIALVLALAHVPGLAADGARYPNRPVRLDTSGIGGGADTVARLFAPGLSDALGQRLIIDNRASGTIPGEIVARANPDGYSLLLYSATFWVEPLLQKSLYDVARDFAPVSLIVSTNEQSSWKRVAGFGLHLLAHPEKLVQGAGIRLRLGASPYRCGTWPLRVEGAGRVQRVTLTNGARTWMEECDVLACGFGLVPNVELPLALGCSLQDGSARVDEWQATSIPDVYCVGEITGIGGADCAIAEGQIAGHAATGEFAKAEALFADRASWHEFRQAMAKAFALRAELKTLATEDL